MRFLITGGAGFIGSHLSDALLRQHHHVTVIDNLSTGSRENIAPLFAHPDFEFHCDTIFNRKLLSSLIAASDAVFHLAASVGVRRIIESPVQTIETNVAGTGLVLELATQYSRRIVLTSTSEVYGKSAELPFREDNDLVFGPTGNSRWSYACSKAIDEFLALAYWRQNRLPVTIARLFNTAGPRQSARYGMVLPTFITQALNGSPITVFGSGKQTRCFTHVADIVSGLISLIHHDSTIGEIYNLGSTSEITIHQLAGRVLDATGSHSPILLIPYEQAYAPGFEDMPRRLPDISKAQAAFGFQPRHSLDDILADVVTYARERPSAASAIS